MDTNPLLAAHLEIIKELARKEANQLGDIVFAGGSVPLLYSLARRSNRAARPTEDIDLAMKNPVVGRELKARNAPVQLDILCPESLADGITGVSFLPDIDIAFVDYILVELEPGLAVKVAGPVALFVLKLNRSAKRNFKRGSDLYDLLVVLEQFGAEELAARFAGMAYRPEVKRCVESLARLLDDESSVGYHALFSEMNLPRQQETWVIARFDQFFASLKKAGLLP